MSIFKAYDVRGKYPEEVNEELAYKIGRSMVLMLGKGNFLICRDAREGSEELAEALIKGITEQGANATYMGAASTPMFYYFKHIKNFDAGVMVTASHLPAGFNGFKAIREGRTFMGYDAGFNEIQKMIGTKELDSKPKSETKGTITLENYESEFVDFITEQIEEDLSGVKVVVDASNGMAGPISKKILDKLNADYIGLNMDYNLDNPAHGLNPLKKEALEQAKKEVLSSKADFGAVFDADADRIIFIDETGQELLADYALALLMKSIAQPGDKIVHDLLCGNAFREEAEKFGCKAIESRVGHLFIKQAMIENNARIGSEISGHIFFKETNGAESTTLALLYMISLLKKQDQKLSELARPLKQSWIKSGEINYEVESNEVKDEKIHEIIDFFKDGTQSLLDGIKVSYEDSWFNVRKSNTEPVLRLRVEAKTKEKLESLIKKIEEIIGFKTQEE
jgi:phosphomannomutase